MTGIAHYAFWQAVAADGMLLVTLALLAMAAEPGAKTGQSGNVILWMFLVPTALFAASIAAYTRSALPATRAAAFLLAASPRIVVAARKLQDRLDDNLYKDSGGRMRYFQAGPARELGTAVLGADQAAVDTDGRTGRPEPAWLHQHLILTHIQ